MSTLNQRICDVKRMGKSDIYFCNMSDAVLKKCVYLKMCNGLRDFFCEHPDRSMFNLSS
jgi:hypothetical protein